MRRAALGTLSLWLVACTSAANSDWKAEEPSALGDTPRRSHTYAARAAREVEVLTTAPSDAEVLSTKLEGREGPNKPALEQLRAAAGELGADCVVVTGRTSYAEDAAIGAKQWEVVRGTAYRRSR
jgi:hypothetical protein